ncbi:flavo protein [Lophium mytilinum]|uniref:Flavo protein n=1 Tax=Lophium mytilinum TaxID=390894 RepID=A0A6A6QXV6_9PEZI|nr:flavo protein [Lophium mytilinum]
MAAKIAIINTSTRPVRVGPSVTAFVKELLEKADSSANITTVDVADFNLPVFDEPVAPAMVPAMAQFTKDHSKAWSAEIAKYDAYIIVANEYNFGMSGSTKNAIDFLYNEWIGKPIYIVTYGIMGATNASEQLKAVLTGMKLKVVETRPNLGFHGAQAGPDMYGAIKGELGEASKKDWETEKKEELVKGFTELKELLASPPKAEAVA